MGSLARFGVSIDEGLLEDFDALCASRGYGARSEAIRDLIRKELTEEQWGAEGECSGILTLVYDHHKHDLARRLMAIQHDSHDLVIATMHVHVDHDNCLECLAIKGESAAVRALAEKLITCRGVKYGVFNRTPNGGEFV